MRLQKFIFLVVSLGCFSLKYSPAVSENFTGDLHSFFEFSETSQHLINTFSVLNSLYNQKVIQITSCTVMSQNSSVEYTSYRRFSTCLLRGTRFWKNGKKIIIVHFDMDHVKPVHLTVSWNSLSKLDLLKSFFKASNKSKHFTIEMDSPEVVSEVMEFLTNLPQPVSIQESLLNVAKLNMDAIDIAITPYRRGESLVHLSLLQNERMIYDTEIITNYSSDNKNDFFILPALHLHE